MQIKKSGFLFKSLKRFDWNFGHRLEDGRATVCDVILKTLHMVITVAGLSVITIGLSCMIGYTLIDAFIFPIIYFFQSGNLYLSELFWGMLIVIGIFSLGLMILFGTLTFQDWREKHPPVCSMVKVV